tara:strand:- start:865 stop:1005 length:141 start_codon:yes stop_codon:yes gene_type:complete
MMLIERQTGLGGSTQRLHQKEIRLKQIEKGEYDEEPLNTKGQQVDA